jgi:hypothetical protein
MEDNRTITNRHKQNRKNGFITQSPAAAVGGHVAVGLVDGARLGADEEEAVARRGDGVLDLEAARYCRRKGGKGRVS